MISRFNPSYVILCALSIAVLLQFDYLFEGNHRWLSSRLVIFLAALFFLVQARLSFESALVIIGAALLASLFLISWFEINSWSLIGTAMLNFLSVSLVIAVTRDGLKNCTPDRSNNLLKLVTSVSILLLIIECYFRLAYPMLDIPPTASFEVVENKSNNLTADNFLDSGFYLFKLSSIMFYDSNYVGIYALIVLVLGLKELNFSEKNRFGRIKVILSFVLIILTFSRASIISSFVILFSFYIFDHRNKKYALPIIFAFFIGLVIFSYYIIDIFSSDYSFNTKIQTFISLGGGLSNVSLNDLFFGRGFDEGVFMYSYEKGAYAHAALPLLLGTTGFLGASLYFVLVLFMGINGGKYGYLLLLILFVNGFSIFDPWQLFYFWATCFILMTKNHDKERVV